jgi:hypothetical protein
LWERVGNDAYGEPIVSSPIELRVRWEDTDDEMRKPDSTLIRLAATVVVDRKVPIGSIMWKGDLDDWNGTGSSTDEIDLMQVEAYLETPDLKNRYLRRVLRLSRFRSTLPTIQ